MTFKNASRSFLDLNPNLDTKRSSPEPERDRVPGLEKVLPGQAKVGQRIIVRITVYKCGRQQDPDNAVWKSLVDQLRAIGVIPEDDGETIKLETDQIRVAKQADQGTKVEIIYP